MEQNKVIDIIINLVTGVKSGDVLSSKLDNENVEIYNCRYLLSQVLRQYTLPQKHYFVSEKAYDLWTKIRNDNIINYKYRDRIHKETDDYVVVNKYNGSNKEPYKRDELIKKGDSFIFNDVFSDEHIVPINVIIKELLSLQALDYCSVKKILDKIYICKLLKGEDHNIKQKNNRASNYKDVLYKDYLEVGIKIKDFNYGESETFIKLIEPQNKNFNKGEAKNMNNTIKGNKGLRKKYFENFTINNVQKSLRGKRGFQAINNKGQEIGIVFMCDDKRIANYGNCELCMHENFFTEYGQWHRFTTNGQKIKWDDLVQRLNIEGCIKLFIE